MLGFVQNLFAPRVNPIGVDFGTDCLRLAQVQYVEDDHRLIAAASAVVPAEIRDDPAARMAFLTQSLRTLLSRGGFRGKDAVLSLPASVVHIHHMQTIRTDDEALAKIVPIEAHGKMPIDLSQAMVRHLVAGEIVNGKDPKLEVIVLAAAKQWIGQFLAAAMTAKLNIVGVNVEPVAVVDCFRHVYRRKLDAEVTLCFVDIGARATRAVIARHGQVLFARMIPIGGDHFTEAVASEMGMSFDEARQMRIKLCAATPLQSAVSEKEMLGRDMSAPVQGERRQSDDTPLEVTTAIPSAEILEKAAIVNRACSQKLDELVQELNACRSYYQSVFPEKPVERLIFIGGESRHRAICEHIADCLGITARLGDPLCRMGRISDVGIESGIDRRLPQPAWVVAIGLSMGPVKREQVKHAFESDC